MTEKRRLLTLGSGAAVVYALLTYAAFLRGNGLGSASYLVLAPIGLASLSLLFDDSDQVSFFRRWLFLPWVGTVGALLLLIVLRLESVLCLLVLATPWIAVGTLTIWVWGALNIRKKRRLRNVVASILILAPFAAAHFEERFLVVRQRNEVSEAVAIAAHPSAVWRNIVEVAPLSERELPSSFWNRLGIPKPLSASVTAHRAGGTRVGRFERGLRFIEPIRAFDPARRLELDVMVDATSIPDDAGLRHALTAGYFKVQRVVYTLDRAMPDQTVLRLSCEYDVRSGANSYANVWIRAILGSFERNLLRAIRTRAEGERD
jgi:hypothetical protein